MPKAPKLSVVVAIKDGTANLPQLLDACPGGGGDTEVVLCSAGPAPALPAGDRSAAYAFPADTLIPSLWSEGIRRARGARVALTTAEFVPAPGWLARLHSADLQRWVGVGGAIDNNPASSPRNWAIFFLRYSAFAPPLHAGETDEIAADNALYDRAAILEHPDLLDRGFWEPSFHRRFRAAGRKLALDPELVVVHQGTISTASFARQRYLHGRAYGIERAERTGVAGNLLLLLTSPMVMPLLLVRILCRIWKRPTYRTRIVAAFPWLVRFTSAWARGEAAGYASALGKRRRKAPQSPAKRHA